MGANQPAATAWLQLIQFADQQELPVGDEQLIVSILQQKLYVYRQGQCTQQYAVSTSKHGPGQLTGSYQTPIGIHSISEKIGADVPINGILKGRSYTGECYPIESATHYSDQQQNLPDVITSRILWLKGLEPGLNAGGAVDSKQRYIYIHGTADEAHIGQPASIGCIRMLNQDVVTLFEQVNEGTLVNIF